MKPCPPFTTCPHETYLAIETAPSATQSDMFIAPPAEHNLPTPEVGGSVPLLTLSTVTDSGLPRLLPLASSSLSTSCSETATIHNVTRHIPTRTSPSAAPGTPFVSNPT